MAAPPGLDKATAAGRLGRKSGRGFYRYGGKKKVPDPSVYELFPEGRRRKRFDREELTERVVLRMVNEALRCLGEEILRSARDGDIGAVFGLGFPPFRGGPFRWVDAVGAETLLRKMEKWQERCGERFEPAPLLVERGRGRKRLYG